MESLFYTWKNYRCAYSVHHPINPTGDDGVPLLLIHPIGVGLSRHFWQRFCRVWYDTGHRNLIYNPDLLGCGESDMPHVACTPGDWAEQLHHFLHTVVQKPVILIVQGALLPVALELVKLQTETSLIQKLILAGPPAWRVIAKKASNWQQRFAWNLLDSPVGNAFYRYARREEFLRSFSTKQLFETGEKVDAEWLEMLQEGAKNPASRYAVFSFLARFWQQDYADAIANLTLPTLVVLGTKSSSISKEGKQETPDDRLLEYVKHLPNGRGVKIPGRNVLPYETTTEFVDAIAPFIAEVSLS
ncbi:MAG TPA: alpha/beta hydrolase [Cyanobacteria bacterium UBA11369]|nr:alpha/beta hydrolase [Cyanobacteria bacterium UBA11371]HBE34956.1 alpha/beta hydrolase [Cyanobacteria bacterium UBA11368]HBE48175.1 alpha/beta hydrolase [Cyanobacteria bacterium UBA11369]